MNLLGTPRIIRGLAAWVGGFALFTGALQAAPFLYAPGDLLLAFRQAGGASDYVVNIGKATNFSTPPTGTTLPANGQAATGPLISHRAVPAGRRQ